MAPRADPPDPAVAGARRRGTCVPDLAGRRPDAEDAAGGEVERAAPPCDGLDVSGRAVATSISGGWHASKQDESGRALRDIAF
jgi:hypothetical protein